MVCIICNTTLILVYYNVNGGLVIVDGMQNVF